MNIKTKKLKNGLKVLILSKKHLKTISISFISQNGSIHETDNQNGLAYLTHKMHLRGTKNYPDINKLNFEIEKLGGTLSTSSSKEKTSFNIVAPKENLDRSFKLISEILKYPLLRASDLEKEKLILLSKIKELGDSPRELAALSFSKLVFKDTPYENHPFGKEKEVKNMTIENIKEFKNRYFSDESLLILVGDFTDNNLKNIEEKLNNVFDFKIEPSDKQEIEVKTPSDNFSFSEKVVRQPILNIGNFAPRYGSKDYYKYKLLRIILGGGFGSVLHKKIRSDRNLAYYIYYSYLPYQNIGVGIATSGILERKLVKAAEIMFDVLANYSTKDINALDLERAKGFYEGILTTYIESSSDIASFYGGQLINLGEINSYKKILKIIRDITLDDIRAVAKKYMNHFYMNLVFRDDKYNKALKQMLEKYNENK